MTPPHNWVPPYNLLLTPQGTAVMKGQQPARILLPSDGRTEAAESLTDASRYDLYEALAEVLGMPAIAVHEVTTFYNMYNQQPVGKFKLNVCTNLPCQLRDGQTALDHVCQRLGVEPYGSTEDGVFTVQPSECLGACADAPVMLVNDRQMLSFMSPERMDELLEMLKKAAA